MEKIDCTPTWSKLLPGLLDVYEQSLKKRTTCRSQSGNPHAEENIKIIREQLVVMATAADLYNKSNQK